MTYYLILFLLLQQTFSHSWLECTKYTGDLEDFEPDKCEGLPRELPGGRNVGQTFGADIGMDFRPQAGGARCQGSPTTGTATQVTYEAGKTYTLAWAPKNHVAAECTNAFIPDNFLRVYMAPYNGETDPTQDQFKENQVKASFSDDPHVRGTMDMKGFQNCPKFCENTDKALCTGTITIPADATPGVYTFQWYWAFNSPTDLYATCWEAEVAENTGPDPTEAPPAGADPTTPPQPTDAPVTTTTTTFAPCADCCDAKEIIIPGTGETTVVPPIKKGETEFIDCPAGFEGRIKMHCMQGDEQYLDDPRLFDGYCLPSAAESSNNDDVKDQSGTVAGLSVMLTITLIAFILYIAFTQGWLDQFCNSDDSSEKSETSRRSSKYSSDHKYPADQEAPPLSPRQAPQEVRQRVKSVFTESQTELPVLPEAPEWHYVNESDQTIGPVNVQGLVSWARKVGVETAVQTYVWNGTTVSDWTLLSEVPQLSGAVRSAFNHQPQE